jgi:hypothetical protein
LSFCSTNSSLSPINRSRRHSTMEASQTLRSSRRLLSAILQADRPSRALMRIPRSLHPIRLPPRRYASASTSNSKPIVLEQPDKFRPPSHPQRRVRGRIGQGAYNQTSTPGEREAQTTRKYPHTFPNEGTFLHWFLTNKAIHLWIALVCTFPPFHPLYQR